MMLNHTTGPDLKATPSHALLDPRCSTRVEELDLFADDQLDLLSDKNHDGEAPLVEVQNLGTKRTCIPKAKKLQTKTVAQ
jgi:hypothetical protein